MVDIFLSHLGVYCVMYLVYTGLLIPVSTYFLAYMVPKEIVSKYFRQPHFNDGDDQLFELFPFRYYLTLWIAQYTACQWFANRRKAYDLRKDSPRYWIILSWIYFWIIVVPPVLAFVLGIMSMGYFELTGRPVPKV